MDRKQFLSFLTATSIFLPLAGRAEALPSDTGKSPKIPPFLEPGALIGITSPASYISLEEV